MQELVSIQRPPEAFCCRCKRSPCCDATLLKLVQPGRTSPRPSKVLPRLDPIGPRRPRADFLLLVTPAPAQRLANTNENVPSSSCTERGQHRPPPLRRVLACSDFHSSSFFSLHDHRSSTLACLGALHFNPPLRIYNFVIHPFVSMLPVKPLLASFVLTPWFYPWASQLVDERLAPVLRSQSWLLPWIDDEDHVEHVVWLTKQTLDFGILYV